MNNRLLSAGWVTLAVLSLTACHSRRGIKEVAPAPAALSPTANQEPSLRGKDYKEIADLKQVHFDLNQSTIRAQDIDVLKKNYDTMMQHTDWEFLIEGDCDDRGSTEYNLGLGQRRATAVRHYYVNLGIPGERIATLSYGKEKPLCTEETEECWAQNRRGVTKVRAIEQAPGAK